MAEVDSVVFVVDDDSSVRSALELAIGAAGWRAQTFASAREFLSHPPAVACCCLVLGARLPALGDLELQQLVDRADIPILFLLARPFDAGVLLDAIRAALERSRLALQQQSELRALRERHASLSAREREVMALVVSGLLNKQVGSELGISEITVKAHRGQVMRKMKASSFAELVTMAARLGPPRR